MKRSKSALAQTIFIIVSRRDGVLDRLKGRLVGARAYLTKPFKTQDLLEMIQAQLGMPVVEQTRFLKVEAPCHDASSVVRT